MAQRIAPGPNIVRFNGLGPGFWQVTTVLLLVCIANSVYWLFANVDWLLPSASQPVSDRASDVDGLFKFMAVFGGDIMFIVAGYVIYFSIAFRARSSDPPDAIGVPVHDQPKLEFWWTVLPTLLLVILTVLSINVWHKIQFGVSSPGLTAEVVAHQFYFDTRYPGLKSPVTDTTDGMHLPVGVPVRILITSADVIHQWWVPEFRLKMAAVPGLVQNLNFTPDRTGTFTITCSEFCGVDHSKMQGKLVVQTVPEFNAWLDSEKKSTGRRQCCNQSQRRKRRSRSGKISPNVRGVSPRSADAVRSKTCWSGITSHYRRPGASHTRNRQAADGSKHRLDFAKRVYRSHWVDAQSPSQRAVR